MKNRFQKKRLHDTMMLSGWVFADLLLGLMMIFLVTARGAPPSPTSPAPPTETPTPTRTSTITPTVLILGTPAATLPRTNTPTPTPSRISTSPVAPTNTPQVSISQKSIEFSFTVDYDRLLDSQETEAEFERIRTTVNDLLQSRFNARQRAGIVLTFAGGPNSNENSRIARAINEWLPEQMPTLFDSGTVFRPFIDLTRPRGTVIVEVYVFTVR